MLFFPVFILFTIVFPFCNVILKANTTSYNDHDDYGNDTNSTQLLINILLHLFWSTTSYLSPNVIRFSQISNKVNLVIRLIQLTKTIIKNFKNFTFHFRIFNYLADFSSSEIKTLSKKFILKRNKVLESRGSHYGASRSTSGPAEEQLRRFLRPWR